MPEPTDPALQPSFTSSTYRAIAENCPLTINTNLALADHPSLQPFLNVSNEAPVPEVLLYRLLTIIELSLKQKFPDININGLCLGYTLKPSDTNRADSFEVYYVSWGWKNIYFESVKVPEINVEDKNMEMVSENEPDSEENNMKSPDSEIDLEFENLRKLAELEMSRQASSHLIVNRNLCAFLFGDQTRNGFIESSTYTGKGACTCIRNQKRYAWNPNHPGDTTKCTPCSS